MLKNPDAYKDKPKKETKHIDEEVVEEDKEEPKKVIEPKEQVKKVKEVKAEEPKEDEKPKKIEKGTFGKEMIVINVEQESLF